MTKHRLNRLPPVCVVAGSMMFISPQLQSSEVQVGRYSVRSATPTEAQADLLANLLTLRFPDQIQTIGEAVRHLLQGSGYRLANPAAIDLETQALFRLPLPAVHRSLGPISLKWALETLAGSAFCLILDPVHRLVSFELCTKQWEHSYRGSVDKSSTIELGS